MGLSGCSLSDYLSFGFVIRCCRYYFFIENAGEKAGLFVLSPDTKECSHQENYQKTGICTIPFFIRQ
ncbi:MAG: hypothetical protein D3910_04330 [Candidatus Electrothrix sp. ATG2]|nr:hypothetical protein [Candidatus Electrothrix sp. ATG2]